MIDDVVNEPLNPWETPEGKEVWKTKAQYFTWVRGNLRKAWSDYPIRKVWKKQSLRPVTSQERADRVYHPSTKNVGQCVFCKEWMAGSKLECDHIKPSEGCYDYATAEKFLWHCVGLTAKDFQLACKPCHKIVTLADARGISFEDARIEKQAIAWCKNDTTYQNAELKSLGLSATNAKERRAVYTEYLKSLK